MDNPRSEQAKNQEIQRNESQRKSWRKYKGDNNGGDPKYYKDILLN